MSEKTQAERELQEARLLLNGLLSTIQRAVAQERTAASIELSPRFASAVVWTAEHPSVMR